MSQSRSARDWSILALIGLVLASCSSSDDSDEPTPDTTPPTLASVVQDRTLDPTGQTLVVTFSERVTAATAEDEANYTVAGANVTLATLAQNGTTVQLDLDALALPGTATIDVSDSIADPAGNALVAVTGRPITSTDTTAPTAASIVGETISGPENDRIVVVFDDDMLEDEVETLAHWTVESPVGVPFDVTGATIDYVVQTRTATIVLGASAADQDLTTSASISAAFIGMRDLGGNTVAPTLIGSTAVQGMVEGDVAPPVLLSITPGGGNDALFTFSEAVRRMETADLLANDPLLGTDIILTDASDPGVAATGSVTLQGTVADGDSITISDGATAVTFEFDFGATGRVRLVNLPNDTDSVTIGDGSTSVVFEFDNDLNTVGTPVEIGLDPAATASNLLAAINASGLTITAEPGLLASDVDLRNDVIGAAGNVAITNVDTATAQSILGMSGGGTTGGAVGVAVDVVSPANTVGNLLAAINGEAFNVTAGAGANAESISLTNDAAGVAGNVAITESDSLDVIAFTGMSGGVAAGTATYVATAATTAVGLDGDFQAVATFAIAPAAGDTVRLFGTTDLAGNHMFPATAFTVEAVDNTEPAVALGLQTMEASEGDRNDVIGVHFADAIHPAGALDPANYAVVSNAGALDLSDAYLWMFDEDTVVIALDSANIQIAETYTVQATGLFSTRGIAMTGPSADTNVMPTGDNVAPTIGVSDAHLDANDANSVLITFDEAIDAVGATDPLNYAIAGNTTVSATLVTPRVVRVTFAAEPMLAESLDVEAAALTDLAGNVALGVATVAVAAADATAPTVLSVSASTFEGGSSISISFSEPIDPTTASDVSTWSITEDGQPVDLTGATVDYFTTGNRVYVDLAAGVNLADGSTISVTPTGVTDVVGNAIVPAATTGTALGDSTAPTSATAFVNIWVDFIGTTVDVQFNEPVDAAWASDETNWTGSNGQTGVSSMLLESGRVRVEFSAPIGAADTITATDVTDLSGNVAASIVCSPIE